MNSDTARVMLKDLYGAIRRPAIDDVVRMIMDYAEQCEETYGAEFKWEG